MEIFSKRLKEEREAKGLTQVQIAEILDVPRRTYCHYEQTGINWRQPSFEILCKIAKIFDVSVGYLLGLED